MTQTIKISRVTADAMRYSRPKRRGAQVLVTLLLVLVIVGMATYWTKGYWWPYWAPKLEALRGSSESGASGNGKAAVAPQADEVASADAAASDEPEEMEFEEVGTTRGRTMADWADAPLDYVSAAGWGDEDWLKAVKGFNQALTKYREAMVAGGTERGTLEKIGRVSDVAGERFAGLEGRAPGGVEIGYARAMARKLGDEVREVLASADRAKAEAERARAAARAAEAERMGEAGAGLLLQANEAAAEGHAVDPALWKAEYDKAATRFNQALGFYKRFMKEKDAQATLLPQIEDLAFDAAKSFEAVRSVAGGAVPDIDAAINQCYRLISDCRRQSLEGENGPAGRR